jgi:peptide-methionine (S)-S-oxide reductase
VVRTRVGYAGGTKKNPTYHNLGDHSESVQMDYDPTVISYEKLLDVFWDSHDPTESPWSKQYASIIFYLTDEQKKLAMDSMKREETRLKSKIFTVILPAKDFWLAEDYHQKYSLRFESTLFRELSAMYPADRDLVNSTAAARINGFLDGYGTLAELLEQLPGFGLSPEAASLLTKDVKRRPGRPGCKL